jgi:hypothetical protein
MDREREGGGMARANQHWSAKQARDTQSEAFIIYIINAKKYIYFPLRSTDGRGKLVLDQPYTS